MVTIMREGEQLGLEDEGLDMNEAAEPAVEVREVQTGISGQP